MSSQSPIIILGAPRSGTSLLQHIVRSCPGFVSPARESQHIWAEYVHPSLNDWAYEGVAPERLASMDAETLRDALYDQAISSQLWRLLRRSGIYDSPRLMAAARVAGKPLISVLGGLNRLLPSRGGGGEDRGQRFVDKSVHGALWLELIFQVMPDCHVIHITRDPFKALPSMMEAWSQPERFRSFDVPIEGGDTAWCFGLIPGWGELLTQPLDIRCARQWLAINERILAYAEPLQQDGRYLHLQLESLVGSPEEAVPELVRFLGCEQSSYWQSLMASVPVINSGKRSGQRKEELSEQARVLVGPVRERLGYA